jgi:LysM repeat protein
MKRRTLLFGCGLTSLAMILIVVGVLFFVRGLPASSDQVPPSTVIVDVLTPSNGAEIAVGQPVPVDTKAFGVEPLSSLEFWADGQLIAQETPGVGASTAVDAGWTWQAATEGIHMLFVRARDTQGNTGQSTVVILTAIESGPIAALKGQTLASISDQLGIPLDQLGTVNPGVDPQQALDKGQPVNLPGAGSQGNGGQVPAGFEPPDVPAQEPSPPPNPLVFWLDVHLLQHLVQGSNASPPDIALNTVQCKARLYITPKSDNASGFIIYHWQTGDAGFQKIATLGPGQNGIPILYEDPTPLSTGIQDQYYVSAFDTMGEHPSPVVAVPPNPCTPSEGQAPLAIQWHFKATQPVDRSYCYQSFGDDMWWRMPADPFSFWPSGDYFQTSLSLGKGNTSKMLSLECWGWAGGDLKFLGRGQTAFDSHQPPQRVTVTGNGFQLTGDIQTKPLGGGGGGLGGDLLVPAPYALREALTVNECVSHGFPLGGQAVCNALINAPTKQYYVLVWEWSPATCWGSCTWVDKIDGYRIYRKDDSQVVSLLKDIDNPNQKVAAVPLPWAGQGGCYLVQAYAKVLGGELTSNMASYCHGKQPEPQYLGLTPTKWLTTASRWVYDGCEGQGTSWPWGPLPGSDGVSVGVQDIASDNCSMRRAAAAAVWFDIGAQSAALSQAVIEKATLSYNLQGADYHVNFGEDAGSIATNEKPLCPQLLGIAKQDWTGLSSNANHLRFDQPPMLSSSAYVSPYSSVTGLYKVTMDVTPVVQNWLKNPTKNHGFVLYPNMSGMSYYFYSGAQDQVCVSYLNAFGLEVLYFTPPGQ